MLIVFSISLVLTIGRSDSQSFLTKTVGAGEDVTLTCKRDSSSSGILMWMKLVTGNLPEVLGITYTFDNATARARAPGIAVEIAPGSFILHMKEIRTTDAAFYYCKEVVELKTTILNITLLRVKGPEPDIKAVILPPDPVHLGDSVTLQCSIRTYYPHKTCSEDDRVYWFKARSDESHSTFIYAHGNSGDECRKHLMPLLQSCVYSFTKNINSSDVGTYYCAVATCGEIFFGNGIKLDIEDSQQTGPILFLLSAALTMSLIVVVFLIYALKNKWCNCCDACFSLQTRTATTNSDQQSQQRGEDSLVYVAPTFARRKPDRGVRRDAKAAGEESVYSDVKVFELN